MKTLMMTIAAVAVLAACTAREDRILFDGKYFRTKISKVDGQRDQFTVAVRDSGQSLPGAREAGRYEATSYCVNTYGSSDIMWVVGPDSPDEALQFDGDTLILRGACPS